MKAFNQEPDKLAEFLDFIEEDLENVRRVVDFIQKKDIDAEFKVHSKAETAKESVKNNRVKLDQIVKTLVFKNEEKFVAILCPGNARVSEEKLQEEIGGKIDMAEPDEVKKKTGYVIGGVSPFDLDLDIFMEESLLEKELVKPAAGSRVVGVTLKPEELRDSVNAKTMRLT